MSSKKSLDQIIEQMMETVRDSKEQIFEICEKTRREYAGLEVELKDLRLKVAEIIRQTDYKEMHARLARNRLAEVSKEFGKYSNEEVRKAYEHANEHQIQLAVLNQEEKQHRERRDHIERRLLELEDTISRAELLVGQVSVVHNFLIGDLREVGEIVEDAKEKQEFGLKIIEAQEAERKRVARDIHDGPAQLLANVLLRAELIERAYNDKGIESALKEVKDVRHAIKASLADVRRIIYDLRPMALDDLGLIPTLKKYLSSVSERVEDKTEVRFIVIGNETRMEPNLEVALFRLVQEAVQNGLKHAEANQILVKVQVTTDRIMLIISDDGKGFDHTEKKDDSFGIMGMKERVNMLKGEFAIESAMGRGTKLVITVPTSDD
ncbi:sensor histidine kinase [Geomicrobium sp. JSM 1781026]|uniref:sensor histidine kinase n=1 Tax=Geomicrobium sp. JSM 1781026 TaxID=3344580 RepID=UPI0035BF2FB3